MPVLGRPRLAAVFPVIAVLIATALLLLVALSIALQPPDTGAGGRVADALAWARACLFTGGALAFAVSLLVFAHERSGDADEDETVREEMPSAGIEPVDVVARAPSVSPGEEGPMRFTLIALGRSSEDARAIADFEDPRALLAAVGAWRSRYPVEELRIFGPDGAEIARRAPAAMPAQQPAARPRLRPRPGLATGGV